MWPSLFHPADRRQRSDLHRDRRGASRRPALMLAAHDDQARDRRAAECRQVDALSTASRARSSRSLMTRLASRATGAKAWAFGRSRFHVLIDTAGFEDTPMRRSKARMREQTEIAIRDADVILFLIDARAGVLPLDESFAALLRRADKPVVLIANKVEGRARRRRPTKLIALGLGEPIALSAEHGEGMSAISTTPSPRTNACAAEDDEAPKAQASRQHRHRRPPERGQVDVGERTDRRRPPARRPRSRHHARLDFDRLEWNGKNIASIDTAGMRKKAKVQAKLERMSVGDSLHAIRSPTCACW
jgi:hypothetical protein